MKKYYLLTSLLFLLAVSIAAPVFSEDVQETEDNSVEIEAPKWEEFCEAGYENAKATEKRDVFNIFSFVKAERLKQNYWAARREDFNKYLKYCDILADTEKIGCYADLRKSEKDKNDLYLLKRRQLLYENNIKINRSIY